MTRNRKQGNAALGYECRAEEIIFLPCSGGSNCGQITNQVALKLDEEGIGQMYCLAGIGAHIDGMVEFAKIAKRIVALDGCQIACAKNIIEYAGLAVTDWICVTEAGINKCHEFKFSPEQISLITSCVKGSLSKPAKTYI